MMVLWGKRLAMFGYDLPTTCGASVDSRERRLAAWFVDGIEIIGSTLVDRFAVFVECHRQSISFSGFMISSRT